MIAGDSIDFGVGGRVAGAAVYGNSYGMQAIAALSTPTRPVSLFCSAKPSSNSTAFRANTRSRLAIMRPTMCLLKGWSPNDGTSDPRLKLGEALGLAEYCRSIGVIPILATSIPSRGNSVEANRLAANTRLREMAAAGQILLVDLDVVLSDGGSPAAIPAALTDGDGIHLSDAGASIAAAEVQRVVASVLTYLSA